MSKLSETKTAYDKLVELLDQEIRTRSGSAHELERIRDTLNVAFYLLGWGQFEYLIGKETKTQVENRGRTHAIDKHAWKYLQENIKNLSIRRRLDLIFHDNQNARNSLDKEYTVRNEAAHDYKMLPKEAKDVSQWLEKLENLIAKF